jgi:hypothetical protein
LSCHGETLLGYLYKSRAFNLVILDPLLLWGRNIWEVPCLESSWSWQKILGLQNLVRKFILVHVGDGQLLPYSLITGTL